MNGRPTRVLTHYPPHGDDRVPAATSVVAGFDRPFRSDPERLNFRLHDSAGASVRGAVYLSGTLTAVTFEPAEALTPGRYTADVSITPNAGSQMADSTRWSFTVPASAPAETPLEAGPGGPILLITSETNPYDVFYAEILRAEGLNSFTTVPLSDLTPDVLSQHQVAIISGTVTDEQCATLQNWTESGGNLIVMRPRSGLAALAGLSPSPGTVCDGYLRIRTSIAPGEGLVSESIQFHGTADLAVANCGTTIVATIYSDEQTTSSNPAVTLRDVGNAGGKVAAFAYDLAESIVLTRQGNPAWEGQRRDATCVTEPVRPSDLFCADKHGDVGADFVNLNKVAIPQADEQMRLFSKLIRHINNENGPLPQFWYFPRGFKAVLVMAGDDHGTQSGTKESFDRMLQLSREGGDVDRWECPRSTAWIYPTSVLTEKQATEYADQGFDIGVHITTHGHDWSRRSLDLSFSRDVRNFRLKYPSLPPQGGSRLHSVVWSQYTTQPEVESNWGIRYDMNYYYWPPSWVQNRPGFMTGSGLPMRFSDANGGLIDVYQQVSHLVNETFAASAAPVVAMIDKALGPEGYYGAFGTHYDFSDDFDTRLMEVAIQRGVPMVSAKQMLDWTDGRNASAFCEIRWNGSVLTFNVQADDRTRSMLRTLLPTSSSEGTLKDIQNDDDPVAYSTEVIKGVEYAAFDSPTGSYSATYVKSWVSL